MKRANETKRGSRGALPVYRILLPKPFLPPHDVFRMHRIHKEVKWIQRYVVVTPHPLLIRMVTYWS